VCSSDLEITVTGKVNDADWYRIDLGGDQAGYVYAPLIGEPEVEAEDTPYVDIASLAGRKIWVKSEGAFASDYCAELRSAGMIVECDEHWGVIHATTTIELNCPEIPVSAVETIAGYLGLTNYQRDSGDYRDSPDQQGEMRGCAGIGEIVLDILPPN